MGQTGVEGLSPWKIRFIGICEIFGSMGILLPGVFGIYPIVTCLSAIGLGLIMILAARQHYRRKEYKVILVNITLLIMCLAVVYNICRELN